MARKPRRILPFRIPFFRIFYSTTYTTIYIMCIAFLAITPVSMLWQAIMNSALQYVVMIGATYLLTAIVALIIYASRMYTNRTSLAGVGKPYVPIEPEEIGKKVRKMIVSQFERSSLIAWESRPRDLFGEILQAEQRGFLPPETASFSRHDYTVGREIPLDPASPPWGVVQHAGWSSPAQQHDNSMPNVQFAPVVAELPNLIEARAVSLAPPDPAASLEDVNPIADPVVVEVLRRPESMGLRDYLTQLSYLGLVNPPVVGQSFLQQYERARFGGLAINNAEFKGLMTAFADLLSGMTGLSREVVDQIRLQAGGEAFPPNDQELPSTPSAQAISRIPQTSPPRTPDSSIVSPVTARSAPSRNTTPYMAQESADDDALDSQRPSIKGEVRDTSTSPPRSPSVASSSLETDQSDSGSVLRHRTGLGSEQTP